MNPRQRRLRTRRDERWKKKARRQPGGRPERVPRVSNATGQEHRQAHFQPGCNLSLVEQRRRSLYLARLPPLFQCRSADEIRRVITTGQGSVTDIFLGFNPLQWYCNAKSTSPSIIKELLKFGININAVNQSRSMQGPLIGHTALGYACRNVNVKAVNALLRHGASPHGLAALFEWPMSDINGMPVMHPSPLQELLCQPIHGLRPGRCPWVYHISGKDEADLEKLEEDELDFPVFRDLPRFTNPVCEDCMANYPSPQEAKFTKNQLQRARYSRQVRRIGNRILACLRLLFRFNRPGRPLSFADCDDPRLWSGLDDLLETVWHFLGPLAKEWSESNLPGNGRLTHLQCLSRIPPRAIKPFDDICDILIESGGYRGLAAPGKRGQERLFALICAHPDLASFRQGESFGPPPTPMAPVAPGRSLVA
ncbi:hypothetical protein GGR50DRAFT_392058 [Xylaria sp. CBS 124048]|nr:hypothetical protein GGR50DRAFT_392058 [Xylaria sp. CBS 124048]